METEVSGLYPTEAQTSGIKYRSVSPQGLADGFRGSEWQASMVGEGKGALPSTPLPPRAWEPQGSSEQDQEVEGGTNLGQNFPAISPCAVSISKRKQRDRWGHWSPEIPIGV